MRLVVPGKPVSQGRARVMRGGWAFDPVKSRKAKENIKMIAFAAHARPMDGNLRANLSFYGANPLSDIDNLVKLVLDALQGICYANDRQIMRLQAAKIPYPAKDACTIIELFSEE